MFASIAILVGYVVWLYLITDDEPTDPQEWLC